MQQDEPIVSGMAGRYAVALFELARDNNVLDQVSDDLNRLQDLINGSEDLARLVRSPVFSRDQQLGAMEKILGRLKVSDLTSRFINVIIENRRLFAMPDMFRAFRALLAEHRGEMTATVISAQALEQSQKSQLESTLKDIFKRDVDLNEKVDSELIGGLIVKVGSRMVDASLATQLNNIQLAMREA